MPKESWMVLMAHELQSLLLSQLTTMSRETTVFFICVGPVEDHGPHLPVGMDLIEAQGLAHVVADQIEKTMPEWNVVFLPSSALGIESNTSQFSIRVRPHVLRDYLVDVCHSLALYGFKNFVCFTGHSGPKQLTAIEEAGKLLRRKHKTLFKRKNLPALVSANSVLNDSADTSTFAMWMDPVEHAGKRDTSMALIMCPEKVDPQWAGLTQLSKEGSLLDRWMKFQKKKISNYWGNPSLASREEGAKLIQEKVDILLPKLKAVWEGARPEHVFKSWYSIYPTNWSLFKVWVLITALMLVLGFWLSMAFQTMIAGTTH